MSRRLEVSEARTCSNEVEKAGEKQIGEKAIRSVKTCNNDHLERPLALALAVDSIQPRRTYINDLVVRICMDWIKDKLSRPD